MRFVFYVSGHGLGHSTRDIEIIASLKARCPAAEIIVRTSAQRWLFDLSAPAGVQIQELHADTGVVQIDSLRPDENATAADAKRFYADFDRRAAAEADVLRGLGADLVVGDIPPLAFAAAARAGIRSVAIGNFTWDWIYNACPAFDADAPDVIPTIRSAYALATRALRLPLHGGFESMMSVVEDIPLVARHSTRDRAEVRRILGVDDDRPVVLPSFGAYGAELPIDRVTLSKRFAVLAPRREPPHNLRYQDLVAASDVVISKPGYGIVSECIANGAALLYTSRGRFREYDVFVDEMPQLLRCRYISQEDLSAGAWDESIEALLAQPPPPDRPRTDGADVAADLILRFTS
jgi:hypothetical protein